MFNIKTLVAVAALAAAGTASANVLAPNATLDGGEMSLTLWSETAQASFLFDTGIMLADFRAQAAAPGFKYEVDLSGNTEYQAFMALVGSATDVKFAFLSGDNAGVQAAQRTMITTIGGLGDATLVTNGNMVNAMNQLFNNYLSVANLDSRLNVSTGGAANGSATFQKGVHGNAYWGEFMGDDLAGQFQQVTGMKGDSIGIYDFVRSGTSGGLDATETPLGGNPLMTATYAGNTFTVTAVVPEPSTYALMLAGLGIVGAVASRRRAK